MSNAFEKRLEVIKHMSRLMFELSDFDFDKLTPEQEQIALEDFEELLSHLLDSVSFQIKDVNNDGSFICDMKIIPVNDYIEKTFGEEGDL